MLEEYGKNARESEITSVRDPWFKMAHDLVDESLATGDVLRGVLFWEWDKDGNGDRNGGASTVRDDDTTVKVRPECPLPCSWASWQWQF